MQIVDPDRVERFKVTLPHPREGQPVEPGVVGYEADDAPASLLDDAPFRHAKETDIEIVQALALGPPHALGRAVGFGKFTFFIHGHTGEAVIGRVAEDHENRRLLLHPLRPVAFFLQLGEGQRFRRFRLPPGKRIGEEDTRALHSVIRQRRVEVLHGNPDL